MPVNEHDEPYVVPHQQAYTSQYVQLPFQQLQNYADRSQQTFDAAEQGENSIRQKLYAAQALNKDKALRNEILNKYESDMVKNLEAVGGDYAMAIPRIKEQGRQMNEDFTRGRLGAIVGNQRAAQAYQQDLQTKYNDGKITLTQYNGLAGMSMANYQGVQDALQSSGVYNSFSGISAANKVDIDAKVETLIKDYAADKWDSSQYQKTLDGGYRFLTKNGWKEVRAEDVYRDVEGSLRNDKEVMDYLSQLTMIEGHQAKQAGKPFDAESSLNKHIRQYASRGASKAGFREAYNQQEDYKADEYKLARFKAGLEHEYEMVADDMQYQSETMSQNNVLTHATNYQGDKVDGVEGLDFNLAQWDKQGAKALKGFIHDLDIDVATHRTSSDYGKYVAQLDKLKQIMEGENGYIEVYKMLRSPDHGGITFLSEKEINEAVATMDGFMNNRADALNLKKQAEAIAMEKTGYDPQKDHNAGMAAAAKYAATSLKDLPEGLTAQNVLDAAFGTGDGTWKRERDADWVQKPLGRWGTATGMEGDTRIVNTKTGKIYTLPKREDMRDADGRMTKKNILVQLDEAYKGAIDIKARTNYNKAVDKYLDSDEVNVYQAGGGPVGSIGPGYVQNGATGEWEHSEEQALKNTKAANNYWFQDPKKGTLHQGNWIGLNGFILTPDGMKEGGIVDLLMEEVDLDPDDAEDRQKFFENARSSSQHLSKAPTLRYQGQPRRFYEFKVNYGGNTGVVKVPATTSNITSTSIQEMINNPAEQILTRVYDMRSKGVKVSRWDQHPDVIFDMTKEKNKVTMPNPYVNVKGHKWQGQATVTVDLQEAIPALTGFIEKKKHGTLDKGYLNELNDAHFETNLAPQADPRQVTAAFNKVKVNTHGNIDFNSMAHARNTAATHPNTIEPNSYYRVSDESGTPQNVLGADILSEGSGTQEKQDYRDYVQELMDDGMSKNWAISRATKKFGHAYPIAEPQTVQGAQERVRNPNDLYQFSPYEAVKETFLN
jgi:hypothetical protein